MVQYCHSQHCPTHLSMWICVSLFHSLLSNVVHWVETSQSTPDQDSLTNILNVILLKSLAFKPSFVFLFLRRYFFSSNSALNILSQLKTKAKNLFFLTVKWIHAHLKSKFTQKLSSSLQEKTTVDILMYFFPAIFLYLYITFDLYKPTAIKRSNFLALKLFENKLLMI